MEEFINLEGSVEDIIYENSENGYTVFHLMCDNEIVICVGVIPQIHEGENLSLTGNWTFHSTYGKQFKVEFYEKTIPTTVDGMEKYLSSGLIKGIGPKTAKKNS